MLDPKLLIETVGLIGIIFIIFAETGLFFGFFFPGDSLLFTAGILASQNIFNIYLLIILCILAAILGDSIGYWSGKKYGRKLFERDAGFFFKKQRIYDAEKFYDKYGKYTIIIARFVPIIRTFAPIVAGIGKMHYRTFISYNIFGGILWVFSVTILGYIFGGMITNPDRYIIPLAFLIIFISIIPIAFKIVKEKYFKNK
jgi:membrane-associated protein